MVIYNKIGVENMSHEHQSRGDVSVEKINISAGNLINVCICVNVHICTYSEHSACKLSYTDTHIQYLI